MENKKPLSLRFDIDPSQDYDGSASASMAQQGMIATGVIYAYVGEVCVGDFAIDKRSLRWNLHSHVDSRWQRQGIASAVYDHVERLALDQGARLEISSYHTRDAAKLWEKRLDPERKEPPGSLVEVNALSFQLAARRVAQRDKEDLDNESRPQSQSRGDHRP